MISPRQFKYVINKWEIQKSVKQPEMQAIVAESIRREQIHGKPSEFIVRGHKLRKNKIDDYLKRQRKIKKDNLQVSENPTGMF
jgi:hypothetical protein